jgi:hypothetical protein
MKDKIRRIIQKRKKDNPIHVRSICAKIGVDEGADYSCPKTRDLIRELIFDGNPIGSNSNGYFWITTYDELTEYIDSLQGRINGIEQRIKLIRNAWALTIVRGKHAH